MDQLVTSLLTQGGLGIVAGIFFWLYIKERSEHNETRREVVAQLEARRLDAVETRTDITSVLGGMSNTLLHISDKIEVGKQNDGSKK